MPLQNAEVDPPIQHRPDSPILSAGSSTTLGREPTQEVPPAHDQEKHRVPVVDGKDYTLKKRPWRRYVTPWQSIVSQTYAGEGTVEHPFVVDWIPGDAENPMTWKEAYKWAVTMMVAVATLAVAMASSTL